MPSRVRWHLRYTAASEDDLNRIRRDTDALRVDPHVIEVSLEMRSENPFTRDVRVVFRDGFVRPRTPEIAYLNLTHAAPTHAAEVFETLRGMVLTTPTEQRPMILVTQAPNPEDTQRIVDAVRAGHGKSYITSDVFDITYMDAPPKLPAPDTRQTSWARVMKSVDEKD